MAAILPNGRLVEDFMKPANAGERPAEGSGLEELVNPVTIDGIRGWNEFVAGGWAVAEEIFPSKNLFEYRAQHRTVSVSTLYYVYNRYADANRNGISDFIADLLKTGNLDEFHRLSQWWTMSNSIRAELQRREKIHADTIEESIEIYRSCSSHSAAGVRIEDFVADLSALSRSRLAHISSSEEV
jgi:hypothetical protein